MFEWDWFFETIENVYHERLNENKNDENETRERSDAIGHSKDELNKMVPEPMFKVSQVEMAIEKWKLSKKTKIDYEILVNDLKALNETKAMNKTKEQDDFEMF